MWQTGISQLDRSLPAGYGYFIMSIHGTTRTGLALSAALFSIGVLLVFSGCESALREPEPAPRITPGENTLQTGGVRIRYPAGMYALVPEDATSETPAVVLHEPGRSTGTVVHIDAVELEGIEPDRTEFAEFLATRIAGNEAASRELRLVAFEHHDAYLFRYGGETADAPDARQGAAALVYESDARIWVLNAENIGTEQGPDRDGPANEGLDSEIPEAFLRIVAGFNPAAPEISARQHENGVLFVELENWFWIGDSPGGFTVAARASDELNRHRSGEQPVVATIARQAGEPEGRFPIPISRPLLRFEVVRIESVEEPHVGTLFGLEIDDYYIETTIYGLAGDPEELLELEAVRELLDRSLSVAL